MRFSKSRSRSKSNRKRSAGNIVNRVFDSSGPEGKVRGTPQQIIDKYDQLPVMLNCRGPCGVENFRQHAEHYTRMLAEAQREMDQRRDQDEQREQKQQSAGAPAARSDMTRMSSTDDHDAPDEWPRSERRYQGRAEGAPRGPADAAPTGRAAEESAQDDQSGASTDDVIDTGGADDAGAPSSRRLRAEPPEPRRRRRTQPTASDAEAKTIRRTRTESADDLLARRRPGQNAEPSRPAVSARRRGDPAAIRCSSFLADAPHADLSIFRRWLKAAGPAEQGPGSQGNAERPAGQYGRRPSSPSAAA